jgi:hypothetical protein
MLEKLGSSLEKSNITLRTMVQVMAVPENNYQPTLRMEDFNEIGDFTSRTFKENWELTKKYLEDASTMET